MQHSRLTRNLAIILLLSSALTIGLMPSVSSQQYTTSTSFLTSSLTQTTTYNSLSFATTTSTGTGTSTDTNNAYRTLQYAVCKFALFGFFNSTGMTHFQYSAGGPMTLYIIGEDGTPFVLFALIAALAEQGCNTPVGNAPTYLKQISGSSYPASGSLDLNLPPSYNPYVYAMMAPLSEGSPTATLAISPVWGTYTNIVASSIAITSTTSSTTTLTFFTTLEVPFTQTYGGWIVAAIMAIVVFVAVWIIAGRRTRQHS